MSEISIDVDVEEPHAKLDALAKKAEDVGKIVDDAIEKATKKQAISLNGVIAYARNAWNILDTTLEMFGVTMDQSIRMVVTGIFTALPPLIAIANAEVLTGVMAVQGVAALASLGSAMIGAYQLQNQASDATRSYTYMAQMSRQIISLAGRF